MKKVIALAISVLLVTAASSAQAAFQCQASNGRNQAWAAVSHFEGDARRTAIQTCKIHSRHRHSCRIDFCRGHNRHFDGKRFDRNHNRAHIEIR